MNRTKASLSFIICVDFDGTIVTHEYPNIGFPIKGAIETLIALQKTGHKIILYTMRSGKKLIEAARYLEENGIELYGLNENPTQKEWTQSPKVYGHFYIDDAALGCPLICPENRRPHVDWTKIRNELVNRTILRE